MKYLFVIARYSNYRQKIFDEIISPRNQEYCDRHGYKYVVINNSHDIKLFRNNPTWWKYTVIRDLIKVGKLNIGDTIVNMDADMYWVKTDFDIAPKRKDPNIYHVHDKDYSFSIDSGNTWCQGWIGFNISDWSIRFIDNILDEERWDILKEQITIHDRFKTYSSFHQEFREQAAVYALFGVKRHSDISFWDLPDYGICSDTTVMTEYGEEDLECCLDIFPTTFNVTEWEGESSCQFNINKVKKEDVVLRHFAGGQSWENIKNWINV